MTDELYDTFPDRLSLRSSVIQGGCLKDVKIRVGMKAEMKTAELSVELKNWLIA